LTGAGWIDVRGRVGCVVIPNLYRVYGARADCVRGWCASGQNIEVVGSRLQKPNLEIGAGRTGNRSGGIIHPDSKNEIITGRNVAIRVLLDIEGKESEWTCNGVRWGENVGKCSTVVWRRDFIITPHLSSITVGDGRATIRVGISAGDKEGGNVGVGDCPVRVRLK